MSNENRPSHYHPYPYKPVPLADQPATQLTKREYVVIELAKAITSRGEAGHYSIREIVVNAIGHADALLAALKEGEK